MKTKPFTLFSVLFFNGTNAIFFLAKSSCSCAHKHLVLCTHDKKQKKHFHVFIQWIDTSTMCCFPFGSVILSDFLFSLVCHRVKKGDPRDDLAAKFDTLWQNLLYFTSSSRWYLTAALQHGSIVCLDGFFFSSVLQLRAVRLEAGLWYEILFINRSDLFWPHIINLFSAPWQFSLGTRFNIGQDAICIYISFFIRPCSLSRLKTLRIWQKLLAVNLK